MSPPLSTTAMWLKYNIDTQPSHHRVAKNRVGVENGEGLRPLLLSLPSQERDEACHAGFKSAEMRISQDSSVASIY